MVVTELVRIPPLDKFSQNFDVKILCCLKRPKQDEKEHKRERSLPTIVKGSKCTETVYLHCLNKVDNHFKICLLILILQK